ncbi:hypothetical protein CU098_010327 [Rhizopus stolonifer]|uniref:FUN14 domain-containing protein 1 n=2 Tax=Mucorineae TaxID=1344963 RepID=A0A367JW05_RHIST|nr:hypothetical protein CU098_010327 [Rhizopus stolonifer]
MLRLPRTVNTLKACSRQPLKSIQTRSLMTTKQIHTMPVKHAIENKPLGASKIIALATAGTMATPLLFKKPAQCQAAAYVHEPTPVMDAIHQTKGQKSIFNRGELTFGTFLGLCTGFLVKKVGKLFAAFIGTGFVFLQYLSQQGYVTVHWDRLEGRYNSTFDTDKDGRVTRRDLSSKWQNFVNFLTSNIQFKSTFLVGFFAGLRYM